MNRFGVPVYGNEFPPITNRGLISLSENALQAAEPVRIESSFLRSGRREQLLSIVFFSQLSFFSEKKG